MKKSILNYVKKRTLLFPFLAAFLTFGLFSCDTQDERNEEIIVHKEAASLNTAPSTRATNIAYETDVHYKGTITIEYRYYVYPAWGYYRGAEGAVNITDDSTPFDGLHSFMADLHPDKRMVRFNVHLGSLVETYNRMNVKFNGSWYKMKIIPSSNTFNTAEPIEPATPALWNQILINEGNTVPFELHFYYE